MNRLSIGRHCCAQFAHLDMHKGIVTDELLDEVRTLAHTLKGVRICNINSTAAGGGVAECLSRESTRYGAVTSTVRRVIGNSWNP